MRHMKKLLASMLVAVLALAFSSTLAFAAGNDGSITIQNTTTNKTYSIYKVFDATYSGENVSYTYDGSNATFLAALQANDSPFTATAITSGPMTDHYQIARKDNVQDSAIIAWIKANAGENCANLTKIGDVTGNNGSATQSNLAYGYYYITTTNGSAVTIDSALKDVTVIDKNQSYSIEKNIVENGNDIKTNEAGLNEDVNFKIAVNATNYNGENKVFKYFITDLLDAGMTYKADGNGKIFTVKVNGTEVTPASIALKKSDGTTTTTVSEAQKAEITINWTTNGTKAAAHLYDPNSTITVEYTAFLDPAKEAQLIIGGSTDGNTNTAKVQSFEGPDDGTTPDTEEPNGDLGEDHTDTFTTELTISKVDESGKALEGAEFTLTGPTGAVVITSKDTFAESATGTYWKLANGTYTTDDPTTPNADDETQPKYDLNKYADYQANDGLAQAANYKKYAKTTSTVVTGAGQTQTDIKATVGADGKVTFTGLGAGEYTLSESVVPAGYNPIPNESFKIGFTSTPTTDSEGKITGYTVAFTSNNTKIQVGADNKLITTVENKTGTELPSTGGMGTTILYIIGGIMVLLAVVFLITKKRVAATKKDAPDDIL